MLKYVINILFNGLYSSLINFLNHIRSIDKYEDIKKEALSTITRFMTIEKYMKNMHGTNTLLFVF
jgi:hypothetical protein